MSGASSAKCSLVIFAPGQRASACGLPTGCKSAAVVFSQGTNGYSSYALRPIKIQLRRSFKLTITPMKPEGAWTQDRWTPRRRPCYERSQQSSVGIQHSYAWIHRGFQAANAGVCISGDACPFSPHLNCFKNTANAASTARMAITTGTLNRPAVIGALCLSFVSAVTRLVMVALNDTLDRARDPIETGRRDTIWLLIWHN
jgi:hypothetical protein